MMVDLRMAARALREFLWSLQFKGFTEQLIQNIREESMFPELPRKSRVVRVLDNLRWYLRFGEMNRYYNSYGFDVKGLRDQREYLPRNLFRRERNNLNLKVSAFGWTRICILRDKSVFGAYMGKCLGQRYVPEDIGIIRPDGEVIAENGERVALSVFFRTLQGDFFVKRLQGECGEGCYLIEIRAKSPEIVRVNGRLRTLEELREELKGSSYVVQKRLLQHPYLSRLNPSCVNTLRVVTVIEKGEAEPRIFAHFLRLGVESPVDNRAAGGLAVLVDGRGVLRGKGFGHHAVYDRHPVTDVVFEGYQLPFWDEVYGLVLNAHRILPDIPSIGWDVAFLPDRPILIEGNDNWEICGIQDTAGGVWKQWKRFVKSYHG